MKRFALIGLLALTGCSDEPSAARTLYHEGYSNVRITGWRMFGCGKGDQYSTGFEATSPSGAPVTGVVCAGLLFKGNTVRLD